MHRALATLLLSLWITHHFRAVYAAAIDTLFLCMFRDYATEEFLEPPPHGTSSSGSPSGAPAPTSNECASSPSSASLISK